MDLPGQVEARGRWAAGRWSVTFSRALQGADPGDVVLKPGGVYPVGIALLDGVNEDHNAVAEPVRIWLVPRKGLVSEIEGEDPGPE